MSGYKVRIQIHVDQDRVEDYISRAIRLGYLRDDPTKPWRPDEKRRVIRWLAEKLLAEVPNEAPVSL